MNRQLGRLILCALALGGSIAAHPATITWTGGGGGVKWSNPLNWSPNAVPSASDDVVIDRAGTTVEINGAVEVNRLTLSSGSGLSVVGAGAEFTALGATSADGANFHAKSGGRLRLPNLGTYRRPTSAGDRFLEADGEGSLLSFPNLTLLASIVGQDGQELYVTASQGGRVDLGGVTQAGGFVVFTADGKGGQTLIPSEINLAKLTEFEGDRPIFVSSPPGFKATGGGRVRLPLLKKTTHSNLRLENTGVLEVPMLEEINGVNVHVSQGASLTLPLVKQYLRPQNHGDRFLEADGEGSLLSFPNLTLLASIVGESWRELYVTASNGGRVDLGGVTQAGGIVVFTADGRGGQTLAPSEINLAKLTEFEGDRPGHVDSPPGFKATGGGKVRLPLLTKTIYSKLWLENTGVLEVPLLEEINGASVHVSQGASLTLPLVKQYLRPQNHGDRFLEADGEGSLLSFPNLTLLASIVGESWDELYVTASKGGRVDLGGVTQAGGIVVFTADGRGGQTLAPSEINLAKLTEFEGDWPSYVDSLPGFKATGGGRVRLPLLTKTIYSKLWLENTGVLEVPLLEEINGASVHVSQGASLTLPLVKQYLRPQNHGDRFLEADGEGSLLSFPNLTLLASIVGARWSELYVTASNGGRVDLGGVTQAGGIVVFTADGRGGQTLAPSEINLAKLTEFEGDWPSSVDSLPGFKASNRGRVTLGGASTTFQIRKAHLVLTAAGRIRSGALRLDEASSLTGGGIVEANLTSAGMITMARHDDPLTIQGDLALLPTSSLTLTVFKQFVFPVLQVQLVVSGSASLAGKLAIQQESGLVPRTSDHFRVITWANATGQFAAFGDMRAGAGLEFSAIYNPQDLEITPTPNAAPFVQQFFPANIAMDRFDSFAVTFSETIDGATFTPTDVKITPPAGAAITPTAVERIFGPEYRVRFAEQLAEGNYLVEIGPVITDFAGNAMQAAFRHSVALVASPPDSYALWCGRHFTEQECADPAIGGSESDPDGDGLKNSDEFLAQTNPRLKDTDGDGLPDKWELDFGLDPLKPDSGGDRDNDGLTDLQELLAGTNPSKADTDSDGYSDGSEILAGSNPLLASSVPPSELSIFTAVELEYATQLGVSYQVEVSTDFQTWRPFSQAFVGDGSTMRWFGSARAGQKQFFRVRKLP